MNWHTEPWPAPIPVCSVDNCRDDAFARGWCRQHYNDWRRQQMPTCSIEDCTDKVHSRGWCNTHYQRWYHHGDPLHQPPQRPRAEKKPCSIQGCDKPHHGRGWCKLHYECWRTCGDPLAYTPRPVRGVCSIEGCDKPHRGRGYCSGHYKRWLRHGSPLGYTPRPPKLPPAQAAQRRLEQSRCRRREHYAEMYEEQCQWRERNRDYVRREAAKARAKRAKIPGPRNHQPWTPAEDAIAMRDDITLPEMCHMLGRSYSAVSGRREWLRDGRHEQTSRKKAERIERNNHIRALHAAGHDILDIMVLTGHTRDIVQYTIHHARD